MAKLTRAIARLFGASPRRKPAKTATKNAESPPGKADASAPTPPPEPDDDLMVSADDLVAPVRDAADTGKKAPRRPQTRDEIIAEAMRVRREQSKVLDKIPLEDRARLRFLAEKVLLGGGDNQTRH